MRHWSIILAATAIMLLGFVASLVIFGDEERLKEVLIGHVEARTGRQLSIDGAVSLRFFPRFRIEAEQIRLSNPGEFAGPQLVSSDRMVAEVRVLPLIRGRLETRDISFSGARVNLAVDQDGVRSLGGLMQRAERAGASRLTTTGPLRLEDVEIDISGLLPAGSSQVRIDRVELDSLMFDQSLNLQFEGAFGRPALVSDVRVDGLLFVPADSDVYRLADMRLSGRHAAGGQPFELVGALSVLTEPMLSVSLDHGRLRVNGEQLEVWGVYEGRARPHVMGFAQAEQLDLAAFLSILAPGTLEFWPVWLVKYMAEHDYELELAVDRLKLGPLLFPASRMTFKARGGDADIEIAPIGLPGALLEGALSVRTEPSGVEIAGLAKLDIDDLGALMAAANLDPMLTGVGQIQLRPVTDVDSEVLVQGELEFFDGQFPALAELRELAGLEPREEFDLLRGDLQILPDALVFPQLVILDPVADIRVQAVWLRGSGVLHGTVDVHSKAGSQRFNLAGVGNRPQFIAVDSAPTGQ